jgi:hypothetical protein
MGLTARAETVEMSKEMHGRLRSFWIRPGARRKPYVQRDGMDPSLRTDPSVPEAFGCARDQAVRVSRGARAWIRALRAMTYIVGVGAVLLFGYAYLRLVADGLPAAHQARK